MTGVKHGSLTMFLAPMLCMGTSGREAPPRID